MRGRCAVLELELPLALAVGQGSPAALWHCGTVALWHCGTVALWHCGTVGQSQWELAMARGLAKAFPNKVPDLCETKADAAARVVVVVVVVALVRLDKNRFFWIQPPWRFGKRRSNCPAARAGLLSLAVGRCCTECTVLRKRQRHAAAAAQPARRARPLGILVANGWDVFRLFVAVGTVVSTCLVVGSWNNELRLVRPKAARLEQGGPGAGWRPHLQEPAQPQRSQPGASQEEPGNRVSTRN